MYIIFIKFWLVISIVSFGTLINSNISAQTVENNPRDTWILDSSSGIPVWIALREKSGEGWRLLVYIEPHNYNVNNLRKVYSAFSKQYEDSYYISVKVFTSLNTIQDELTIRKIGLWNIEDLPDRKKSNIQEDVFTNLMRAVSAGNFNVVTYLLKYGANPEVKNNKGETVLNKATNKKIVKLLLKKVSPDSN